MSSKALYKEMEGVLTARLYLRALTTKAEMNY